MSMVSIGHSLPTTARPRKLYSTNSESTHWEEHLDSESLSELATFSGDQSVHIPCVFGRYSNVLEKFSLGK